MDHTILQELTNYPAENMDSLKNALSCTILFGAVGGSVSLGVANKCSDFDYYLVVSGKKNSREIIVRNIYRGRKLDIMYVDVEDIARDIRNYRETARSFPTCLSGGSTAEIEKQKDYERPGFAHDVMTRILLSDYRWENRPGIIREWSTRFADGLRLLDLFNYHYIRAYGNYHKFIENKDQAPVRKYLYTLHQLWTCEWLLDKETKPPMDFKMLLSNQNHKEIRQKTEILLEQNDRGSTDKQKLMTGADMALNSFIEERLVLLLDRMRDVEQSWKEKHLQ